MLFCTIGAVTASADTPEWATNKKLVSIGTALTGNVTEGTYILATRSYWNRWLTAPSETGSQLGYVTSGSVTPPTIDLSTVFYIKPLTDSDGNTTYTFQLSDGDYIAQVTKTAAWGDPVVSSSTAATFEITELEEDYYYAIKDTETGFWIDHSESGPVGWNSEPVSSNESNGAYQLIPVTLEDATFVTYKVLDSDGNTLASQKVLSEVGDDASLPDELKRDYCEYGTLSETTISSTTTEITTTATWTLPFKPTTNIATDWDNANWYTLTINRDTKKYSSYDNDNNKVNNSSTAESILSSSNGTYTVNGCPVFAFVGDNPYSGYKIYNYAAGSGKVLWSSTASNNATIYFTDVESVTDGGDWQLVKNGDYTVFKKIGTNLGYMNDVNGTLGYWVYSAAATDPGSSFTFTEVDMSAISSLAEAANNSTQYDLTTTGELNKYVEATSGTLQTALNNAAALTYSGATTDIESATTAINNAISALSIAQPADGTFIRVQSTQSNLYLRAEASSAQSKRAVIGEKGTSESIFYYKDRHLLGFNNGYYLTPDGAQTAIDGIVSTYQTFDFLKSQDGSIGCYYIETNADDDTNKRWMYAYTDGKDYADCWGTSSTNTNCNFWLEQVTELPVTVTAAGYATLNAPVNLTIPEGVNAYYVSGKEEGTDGNDYVTLTEITGTIPANTPVVLKASEGTYNFTITSEEASSVSGNGLIGLIAAGTATTTDGTTIYTLQYINSTPGFYKYDGTEWKGFKAYYSVSGTTGQNAAKAFLFNDGGTTESIATATSVESTSAKAIYDLQGRRVTKAAKGVYIMNGKKIIFK